MIQYDTIIVYQQVKWIYQKHSTITRLTTSDKKMKADYFKMRMGLIILRVIQLLFWLLKQFGWACFYLRMWKSLKKCSGMKSNSKDQHSSKTVKSKKHKHLKQMTDVKFVEWHPWQWISPGHASVKSELMDVFQSPIMYKTVWRCIVLLM